MEKPGKINRIKIEGFKSIKLLDIELSDINLLIGANGAGKSNFIAVFKLLNQIVLRDLQSYISQAGGADTFLYFGRKNTAKLAINVDFDPNSYNCTLVPTVKDNLVFEKEECAFHGSKIKYLGGTKVIPLAPKGSEESALPRSPHSRSAEGHVSGYLRRWKVYHFHDTSDSAKVKLTCDIKDNEQLRKNAENLAAMLYLFQQNHVEEYEEIIRTINLVAPFFQDFILMPDDSGNIRLRWKHKGTEAYFDASDFSDGTLRFICLATLFLQPDRYLPSIIIIDEPELGLHPHAINILAEFMKAVSKKIQVIATSQSIPLVNQFTAEDIIIVDRKDEASTFRKISSKEIDSWMEEYGMGDIWEKNIFGGNPT